MFTPAWELVRRLEDEANSETAMVQRVRDASVANAQRARAAEARLAAVEAELEMEQSERRVETIARQVAETRALRAEAYVEAARIRAREIRARIVYLQEVCGAGPSNEVVAALQQELRDIESALPGPVPETQP